MSEQASAAAAPLSSTPVPAPKRRRWVSFVLTVVLFLCGCLVGSGLTLIVVVKRVQHAIHHPEKAVERIVPVLQRRLGLTEEQISKVEAILRQRQAALLAIRQEAQPKVEAELDRVEAEVAVILDDSQRAKWHEQVRKLRQFWTPPR